MRGALLLVMFVAALAAQGCAGAAGAKDGAASGSGDVNKVCMSPDCASGYDRPCQTNADCGTGLQCLCMGVGPAPDCSHLSSAQCAEAQCGGRYCIDPQHRPPPPP